MEDSVLTTLILGGSGLAITLIYNFHNRKLANDKMHKELFTEFNKRYDALNDALFEITETIQTIDELNNNRHLKSKLNDFYNLCAEEYFWYKKNRIDESVWKSWQSGMNYWYQNFPIIKLGWEEEMRKNGTTTYYLKSGQQFFKDK